MAKKASKKKSAVSSDVEGSMGEEIDTDSVAEEVVEESPEEPEEAEATEVATEVATVEAVASKPALVVVELSQGVDIKVNGIVYSGRVEVTEDLGALLREMDGKVVERENNVHVGGRYETQRTSRGNLTRRTGTI